MLFARMLRAAMLDQKLYAELRSDPVAGTQAVVVVLLGTGAAVVAVIIASQFTIDSDISTAEAVGRGLIIMPGVWLVPAASGFFLGRIFHERQDGPPPTSEMLTVLGFSAAPAVLLLFLIIPIVGQVMGVLVPLWLLVSMAAAVKSALRVAFIRGLMTIAPGFVLTILIGISQAPSDGGG